MVFPEDLLETLDRFVPGRKRSEFIVLATEKELARLRFRNVLRRTAGAWSDQAHTELKSRGDILKYVHSMRAPWLKRAEKLAALRG